VITSATSFTVFGISMTQRSSRRKLVVLTYVALALVCALATWLSRGDSSALTFAVWAAILVAAFVFGGQGRHGLIKPFLNKPPAGDGRDPIDRLVYPDPVLLKLTASVTQLPHAETDWKNDERELTRRDRAHYLAYQPLALAFVLVLLLVSQALHPRNWLPLHVLLSLIYVVALVASVLTITLPAAIILWTEPDLN
jgi:hypothetical protein